VSIENWLVKGKQYNTTRYALPVAVNCSQVAEKIKSRVESFPVIRQY